MTRRILLLDTGNEWGGGTNSMFELLKRIDRSHFDVTACFYRNYRKGADSDLVAELAEIGIPLLLLPPRRQTFRVKLAKELIRACCRSSSARRSGLLHRIERYWRIDPYAMRIAELLRLGGYDLLYLNNQPSSNLEGYLAAELVGIPVVQHCRIEAKLNAEECAIVNRGAARIICVSEGVRDSLLAQGVRSELCKVVHNAIDGKQALPAAVFLPEVAAETVLFGTVGSLIVRKANDHLLRAAALVKKRCAAPFHLLLVGEGGERARLEALAAELGLVAQVSFAGFQAQALAYTARMDVLVLASAKEGLPRTVLEAMLLGKPVIASDIIGTRELVHHGDSGLLYAYADIEALAAHMQTLLLDATKRRNYGANGRARVLREFSIEAYVAGVEAVLADAGR